MCLVRARQPDYLRSMIIGSGTTLGKFGRVIAVVMACLIVVSMSFQHMGVSTSADMPVAQMVAMTAHQSHAPSPGHAKSPECLVVCAGVSLADLTLAPTGIDAFALAFSGMSAITNPVGRQIGPDDRPPKFA